ncbi:Hypothetical protein NTJ_12791 [Nesidiocoris tenuis]|uniref:VWFC domain-containing protein n=1 Tax=Nesidiocoris tenuis TaxID=355587 RepID=A0ABN7B8L1_9HEMI|nr:Hypothetical protein NTJ_12791 [Nesidiocoris tenuis]
MATKNNKSTDCPFVKVVEKLNTCPCSDVPNIDTGPSCFFKKPQNKQSSCPLTTLLKADGGCPLAKPKIQPKSCVFTQPVRIQFERLPPHQCSCLPGTCPQLAKNSIRSMGFDPMCKCECPETVKRQQLQTNAEGTKKSEKGLLQKSEKATIPIGATAIKRTDQIKTTDQAEFANVNADPIKSTDPAKQPDATENSEKTLLIEGNGFKIFNVRGEKVLYNYSTKNCEIIGCQPCNEDKPKVMTCGCDEWERNTLYRNCCCPGARKNRPKKRSVIIDDRKKPSPETQPRNSKEMHVTI